MASTWSTNRDKPARANLLTSTIVSLPLLLLILTLFLQLDEANCEAKEFDWGDLGLSLANTNKYNGGNNNLRILVSPQRRTAKNYDYEYTNNSQPTSSQGEASYVIPGTGSNYISQPSGQPSHSSAYSALSASLATLKNRLSARGMTLSSSLGDSASPTNLYQAPGSAYGSNYLGDGQQSGQQSQAPAQGQQTYLSVANQQDQHSSGGYSSSQGHSNDNKTIVLAIPAKINFLTDGRAQSASKQQQQQQPLQQQNQHQQLAVVQASGDQQSRPEYSAKQLSLLSGQDGVADPTAHIVSRDAGGSDQEGQQYVIVNSPSVASNDPSSGATGLQTYQSLYQQPPTTGHAPTIKYIPTYQTTVPQPALQKLYTTSDTGLGYPEMTIDEHYGRCLDTCNSADVRWRKHSVSKYKFCCSRSSQYDPQFEQPSSDKLGEATKLADDAYYNYLYRRTRSRRSRRPSGRHSRHHKQTSASSSGQSEEGSAGETVGTEYGRASRYESPYMKYYKARPSLHTSSELQDTISAGNNGKHSTKERSYRRGRGRDYDSADAHQTYDSTDDEGSYHDQGSHGSGSYGYGSGDESVDAGGRYNSDGRASDEEDVRSPSNDDQDVESGKSSSVSDGQDNPEDSIAEKTPEESEPETTPSYKYVSNRRRKLPKNKSRKAIGGKYRRTSRKNRTSKQSAEVLASNPQNGTDYESTSSGDHYRQEPSTTSDDEKQHNKESTDTGSDADKEAMLYSSKIKSLGFNESAVMNLSKTTMHLKEILMMLEKKAHQKLNETSSSYTSTPAPLTTTTTTTSYPYSLLSSQISNSAPLQLPLDYLSSDISLKSPYRFETSSSSGLSLPGAYSPLNLDTFSSLPPFGSSQFGLGSKHLSYGPVHHPRKRRTNKHVRYNQHLVMPKPHSLTSGSAFIHHPSFGKNQLLGSGYYSSLQYPYSYTRSHYPSTYASYPYKNLHKNPYAASLNSGSVSAKLAAAAASGSLYSDDSRIHGVGSMDPLSNVASSLRPTTTLRLRSKPFVFQPHVVPIYTRHTILTQPVDKK